MSAHRNHEESQYQQAGQSTHDGGRCGSASQDVLVLPYGGACSHDHTVKSHSKHMKKERVSIMFVSSTRRTFSR